MSDLSGFAGCRSFYDVTRPGDVTVKAGLELKRLGNRIQEVAGGRAIHPVNIEVGGIVSLPSSEAMTPLLSKIKGMQEQLAALLPPFTDENYPPATPAIGIRLTVATKGEFTLQGDLLALNDGRTLPASAYAGLLKERSLPWSNAKIPADDFFLTGALPSESFALMTLVSPVPCIF